MVKKILLLLFTFALLLSACAKQEVVIPSATSRPPVATKTPQLLNMKDPASIAAYLNQMMLIENYSMVQPLLSSYGAAWGTYFYELPMGDEEYHREFAGDLRSNVSSSSNPRCVGWQINSDWNPPSLEVLFSGVVFTNSLYVGDKLIFFFWQNKDTGVFEMWAALNLTPNFPEEGYNTSSLKSCE